MTFIEKSLIPDLSESPPNRLNIIIVVCYIWVVHIGPKANAVTHFFPIALINKDAVFTLFDKVFNAIIFYLRLAADAKAFLNLEFNWQTVGIPAGFSLNQVSLHRAVPWNQILNCTSKNMTYVRFSICGRRSVKKSKDFGSFTILYTLFKYIVFLPKVNDFLLSVNKRKVG